MAKKSFWKRGEDYAKKVSGELIEQIKRGVVPWQKPWKPGEQSGAENFSTGGNSLYLMSRAIRDGRGDPRPAIRDREPGRRYSAHLYQTRRQGDPGRLRAASGLVLAHARTTPASAGPIRVCISRGSRLHDSGFRSPGGIAAKSGPMPSGGQTNRTARYRRAGLWPSMQLRHPTSALLPPSRT